MSSEHRFSPETILILRRQIGRRVIATSAAVALFLCMFVLMRPDLLFGLVIALVALIAINLLTYRRNVRRAVRQFESFRIVLDETVIRRLQEGLPELSVARSEVTAVEERAGYGMAVYGADRRTFVPVPFRIEGYADVRVALAAWRPIEQKRPPAAARTWLTTIGALAAFAITFTATNRLLVIAAGSVLALMLLVSMVLVLRSPHADKRLKRMMLLGLLPLFAIIARVVAAIGGR